MGIALPPLTPAQESLFLTLGSRAIDSRLPSPLLGDTMADDIVTAVGYDLDRFPTLRTRLVDPKAKIFDVTVRAKRIDEVVRRFVLARPDAVVLDLGAGLDGRVFRVDPPPTVDWYDVDFPEVVALRRQLVPPRANAHNVAADLTDPGWLAGIPGDRPAMLVADGLLPFVAPDDLVALLGRLTAHSPAGELALNAYTRYLIWGLKHSRAMRAISGGVANPGFSDPRLPERWGCGLTLLEEIFLTRAPEVAEMARPGRAATRLAARSARVSRMIATVVLRYSF